MECTRIPMEKRNKTAVDERNCAMIQKLSYKIITSCSPEI